MTKEEAIGYLTGIDPQPANIVTLDATVWADFKASMLEFLNDPTVDPKYREALEAANVKIDEANEIIDSALG